MTLFYTRSDGTQVAIADMAWPHLQSAHAKLAREITPERQGELDAMGAELERRQAEFDADVAALKAEGYISDQFDGQWFILNASGTEVTGLKKTENAAWSLAISRAREDER